MLACLCLRDMVDCGKVSAALRRDYGFLDITVITALGINLLFKHER